MSLKKRESLLRNGSFQTILASLLCIALGLLVGYINNIDLQSDGLMLNIDVRSYVDFAHLEEVIVLMPKNRRN